MRFIPLLTFLLCAGCATPQAVPPASTSNPLPSKAVVAAHAPSNLLDGAAIVHSWQQQQGQRLAALQQASKHLHGNMSQLCKGLNPARLEAARTAWRDSYLAWRALEALPMGPMLSRRSAWQLDVWPIRIDKVEEAVRLSSPDAPIADSIGASAQGLPALEYLLWGEARPQAQLGRLHFKRRCQYSLALSAEIESEALALAQEWPSYHAAPLSNEAGLAAFEEAINLLAASMENLRDKKLARLGSNKPLKKVSAHDFDGWRSQQTKAGLSATLTALEQLLLQASANHPSFVDRLSLAKPMLAQHLRNALSTARHNLDSLPPDLAGQAARKPELLKPFLDSIRQLQALFELQVADALGVSIGFKDNDGD